MDTNANMTTVQFFVPSPLTFLATFYSWSADRTILTCSPTPAFPSNKTIFWGVTGKSANGESLSESGFFSAGSGGPAVTLVLTNSAWAGNMFSFDVVAPASQTITVEFSSTLQAGSWTALQTTNTPAGGTVHIIDPHSSSNRFLFYHARTGS